MVKCLFCQYENEDGAFFCEQCKSDLGTEAGPGHVAAGIPVAAVVESLFPRWPEPALAEVIPGEETPFDYGRREETTAPVPLPANSSPATETGPRKEAAPAPAGTPNPAVRAIAEHLSLGAKPRLVVLRGLRIGVEYPLYEGHNFIGRMDEKPVDIDLEDQESPDRVLCSRQHAVITFEEGKLIIEDLNSTNYTYVNRTKIYPGQRRPLKANDLIQVGTVQLKVLL